MRHRIRQILYDIRQQPLISTVTLVTTALAVFLIMTIVITQRVKTVPFPPESCRDRLLVAKFISINGPEGKGRGMGPLDYKTARRLFTGLDGVEQISYMKHNLDWQFAHGTEPQSMRVRVREADGAFFRIFDHTLTAGRYYTDDEVKEGQFLAVITEETARKVFGTTNCIGARLMLNRIPRTVVGVIRNHSSLALTGRGDVFVPYRPIARQEGQEPLLKVMGDTYVALMVKEGVDFQSIRDQVYRRVDELATELKLQGYELFPKWDNMKSYDKEGLLLDRYSIESDSFRFGNVAPELTNIRYRYILYLFLLAVPAINLSSMLHSRLQKRFREIGIRRAFGCPRGRILGDIVGENFLITLAGGFLGIAAGMTFAMTYTGQYDLHDAAGGSLVPTLGAVANWGTVGITLGVCVLLNVLSAIIPAWHASRMNPAEAIRNRQL